ncbi:hypothetical protein B0W47_02110 [Komagataeibacter nataicola]|uniref:Uncharacterized protein n=2 Tax=Komagataeibacter TaxID=1434011 RepID=A0A9N7GZC5_9PROT|nr:hypothetical protein B0W47_02110 [Komagataeibacter nataicola]PYD65873.1 hypothetical protein CDI09_11435 [Komagataeibacter nataicola]PYD80012.1 hypothetical protein CFR77_05750 [Komagataeibacter sucrofermentans]
MYYFPFSLSFPLIYYILLTFLELYFLLFVSFFLSAMFLKKQTTILLTYIHSLVVILSIFHIYILSFLLIMLCCNIFQTL